MAKRLNKMGFRSIAVKEEGIVVHGREVWESKHRATEIDAVKSTFTADVRIVIRLEDGRTLNKVFDLTFDEDDIIRLRRNK